MPLPRLPHRNPIAAAVLASPLLRRAVLWALVCLASVSLSCARQQSRPSPQTKTPPQPAQQNPRAAQPPPPQSPAAEARAVIVAAPEQPEQPQQAGGQPPDRLLASGHTAAITAITFSPDRQRAATASDDKTIRIWDLATSSQQRVLTGHTDRIDALAFSPDGTRLASASGDGTVRVWDPATGNSIYAFALPSRWVEQVAFSADGQLLAASAGADDEGGNSYIEVHDAVTGAKIRGISLDWNNATPLAITPDGRLFSSGGAGEDGEYVSTKSWDLRSGRELKTVSVLFSAFSPDGHWGASLESRQVNLWDLAANRRVRTIAVAGFQASRVTFTPDSARILAASQNGTQVKFFEIATGREVQSLPIPTGSGVVAFSVDGKWLAVSSGLSGSSVAIWDLAAGHEIQTLAGQLAAQDLAFSPDGKLLVTGGAALGLWDVASGKLVRTVQGATQSLIISPDGRWLAANPKGSLEIWDTKTWMRATPSPPSGQFVWWMGFASAQLPLSDLSVAGVRWWQVGAGAEVRSFWGATFPAALGPDGKILATSALRMPSASNYDRPNVSIWDVSTGRLLQTFAAHEVGVSIVAFSPDGKWLATSGQDNRLDPAHLGVSLAAMKHSIKLWDTTTWKLRMSLPFVGTGGGLGNFSPDGRMLAVTSQNFVTLYDVPGGRAIKTVSVGGGGAVRFSPDGQWLAQGSANGIALWNVSELGK